MNGGEAMSEELKHYGVLGMRWGVRRNKDNIWTRVSSRTARGLQRRIDDDDRREARGEARKYDKARLKKDLEKRRAFDAKVQKRVTSMGRGKTFAQTFLMGSRGALRYNQLRTKNYGRAVSFVGAVIGSRLWDNPVTSVIRGVATNAIYRKKS